MAVMQLMPVPEEDSEVDFAGHYFPVADQSAMRERYVTVVGASILSSETEPSMK